MKKVLVIIVLLVIGIGLSAQNYFPLNYALNKTPDHGIKIKTNLPYLGSSQMPTIIIEGYNYGVGQPIGITLNWYIYNGNFIRYGASSYGAYSPTIKLANEEGKVIIYISARGYFTRFQVRAYAKGLSCDKAIYYEGWTAHDEPLFGMNVVTVPYKSTNNTSGAWVKNSESLNYKAGSVGIGTTNTRGFKLAVNGNIGADEIQVKANYWSDFVFNDDYKLKDLEEVESFIEENNHLPDIPSEQEVKDKGINLGDMDAKLLQKIEELTLYMIEANKKINELSNEVNKLKNQ